MRHARWATWGALAILVMATPLASANDRSLTISTDTAGPSQPFKAFDTTPKLFDVNGDGKKEIIAHNDNRVVYVFDGTSGRLMAELNTRYPSGWGARPLNSPEVAVLQDGGAPHVVVANSAAYITLFRYDHTDSSGHHFTKLWERRMTACHGAPSMDAKPVLADLSGNGRMEILVQTEEVGVYALRMDGSTYWQRCIGGGNGEPAVGDLDHDGVLDAVFASDGGVVSALHGRTGHTKWTYWVGHPDNDLGPGAMPVGPTIGQVDGSGPLDVVVGVRDSSNREDFQANHAALFVIKGNGGLLWMRQHAEGNPLTYTHPIIHDVDKNGQADILWGDWNTQGHKPGNWEVTGPANFYRYDAAGNLRWRVELNTYWSNKDLALADVDGDGWQEVLANGPGSGGDGIWYLDSRTGAKERFVSVHPWKVMRGPVVYDIQGDGGMDWVVPVTAATNQVSGGAILVYNTHQGYNAAWPHPPSVTKSPGGSSPPPPSGDFSASFRVPDTTNNWWVQVGVDSDRPITWVGAEVDGDGAIALNKQSWGDWAKSFYVDDGQEVVFVARDGSGNEARSRAYVWGDPSQAEAFDAQFELGKNVNEWWVEVRVTSSDPVDKVTASVNGGSPRTLDRTSWGTWAKSFHVPRGSDVVFTAHSGAATDKSDTYQWLESGPSSPPPDDGAFDATFRVSNNINEWWVEVSVDGNEPIAGVEAQVDGGTWRQLDKTDWGTWAKSFNVKDGQQVRFRATSADGDTDLSSSFTWG